MTAENSRNLFGKSKFGDCAEVKVVRAEKAVSSSIVSVAHFANDKRPTAGRETVAGAEGKEARPNDL